MRLPFILKVCFALNLASDYVKRDGRLQRIELEAECTDVFLIVTADNVDIRVVYLHHLRPHAPGIKRWGSRILCHLWLLRWSFVMRRIFFHYHINFRFFGRVDIHHFLSLLFFVFLFL